MVTRFAGRRMASVAVGAALVMAPVNAFARDSAEDDFAAGLNDPRRQEAISNAMAAMLSAMLDLKAEPLARAMERMGDTRAARKIPPGATLGDLAGPKARRMPAEMRRRMPAMMGAMGELAGMMKDIAPQLQAIGDEFERQMDEAAPTG